MFDLHTHHYRCGHAVGTIEEYIQAAVEDYPSPGLAMARSEFPHYIEEIVGLKKKYENKIEVLIGVESDFFPASIRQYEAVYRQYPIDYLIGSVHVSNGKHLSDSHAWADLDDEQLEREKAVYFDLLQPAAASGVFQIIGHMDLIKRYYKTFMNTCRILIEQTLKVFAETNVSIEVNSSGLHRGEDYSPGYEVLEIASRYGVPVTFGPMHINRRESAIIGRRWPRC